MNIILIVILVANGRSYTETPIYAIEYPTEARCMAAAATYEKSGFTFKKAVCVPKVVPESVTK
jgi:hypothetical protein